jgi:hypothetical protein
LRTRLQGLLQRRNVQEKLSRKRLGQCTLS